MPAINITARAIRTALGRCAAEPWSGVLAEIPAIGSEMRVFVPSKGRWVITTLVRRVMRGSLPNVVYVETAHTVYQLVLHPN